MKLLREIAEDVQITTELNESTGKKNYYIEGVYLQTNKKNKNGRMYPDHIMKKEVDRYTKETINENRAYGELGHPDTPTINLDRVSHMIKSLRLEGNDFIGKAKVTDTPNGRIVMSLLDEGAKLGVSSRGMGSVKNHNGVNMVQEDFYLSTAADIVADPSAHDAFVRGVYEQKEWVWNNGRIEEVTVAGYKDSLDKAFKSRDVEKQAIRLFEDFMSRLK